MEAGQAQGATMDTRGFRWRVRPPCASDRSPGPDATPAGTGRPARLGRPPAGLGPPSAGLGPPSAGLGPPRGMGRPPARIGRPELRKRARAPPLDRFPDGARDPERERAAGRHSVSGNDAGPAGRTPASPAVTQALAVNQHTRKLGVVIYDTLYLAQCKALIGPFTCGIVWTIGNWPAADEVVP